jgi:hypothetical protein
MTNRFVEELKRPGTVIGIALAIISIIIGTLVSVYYYYKGIKEGEITSQVEQVQVFDSRQLVTNKDSIASHRPITVLDASGRPIEENVYAASVFVWNSGSAEIKPDSVRDKFRVVVDGKTKILDMSPVFFTNDNADNFSLEQSGIFHWEHFDPGEGFKVKILYVSPQQAGITVQGRAVDYSGIVDRQKLAEKAVRDQRRVRLFMTVQFFTVVAVIVLTLVMRSIRRRRLMIHNVGSATPWFFSIFFFAFLLGWAATSGIGLILFQSFISPPHYTPPF